LTPDQIRALAIALTRHRSITNSPGETAFAAFLEQRLQTLPVPLTKVWRVPASGDPFGREIVLALVRGVDPAARRTVLLTGHYDTVPVSNYGPEAEPVACDPEALLPLLIRQLRDASTNTAQDVQALRDLESGLFLPGRGLLDMKGGLAAGIAVLQRFARSPSAGNVLFAAVPDEEVASHGMRAFVRELPAISDAEGLDIVLAVNLDSEVDSGDGSQGRAVFTGSVGKMLPLVVFVGRPAHAGAPLAGMNPVLPLAEFLRLVESNPAAGDPPGGSPHPPPPAPPVTLYARDSRTSYDVTMPASAWCAVNVLTHSQSAAEILTRFLGFAAEALRLSARIGGNWPATVLTYQELVHRMPASAMDQENQPRSVEECAASILAAAAAAGLEGPAAIVGFAPPFYPRAVCSAAAATGVLAQVERAAQSMGDGVIRIRPYFPGISDMSFLDPVSDGSLEVAASNCPADLHLVPAQTGIPAVNIGPWGRDYHQKLERLHQPYCFEVLPELLARVVANVLRKG
jgi:arginine utilization protein RocB